MSVKLISGLHITATNKRHIKEVIAQNLEEVHSARLSYKVLEKLPENQYKIMISEPDKDSRGRKFTRRNVVVVEVKF